MAADYYSCDNGASQCKKKAQRAAQEKAEEMAELAEHAQAANKAKTAFLSHMSHDMRTPMNAIIGFTGIAMKNDPSDEVKNCLEKIDESSEYLLSLINDVLDLTHIESGKVKYNPGIGYYKRLSYEQGYQL